MRLKIALHVNVIVTIIVTILIISIAEFHVGKTSVVFVVNGSQLEKKKVVIREVCKVSLATLEQTGAKNIAY